MRPWLSVMSTGLLLLVVVLLAAHRPAVSAAKIKTVQCVHTFERDFLRFAPFFYKKPLVAASLPCRYKLANFKCGDTKAEVLVDVDRHAYYNSKLPHFLRGVIVSLTVGTQRAEYSLSNDTLLQNCQRMCLWKISVSFFILIFCLCFTGVDSAAECSHGLQSFYLRFKPFFHAQPIISTTLPCRFKLANFKCGDISVEAVGDVQRHGYHNFYHILRGVSLSMRDSAGQSATYSISNDTFKMFLNAQDFTKDPWQKNNSFNVQSFFLQNTSAAVIKNGGLTMQYFWHRELSRVWNKSKVTPGPLFTISCTDTFSTYENFPYTVCGNLKYNKKPLLSTDESMPDFPMDLHHSRDPYYGSYAMLAYHNVKQTSPLCEEAATITRGSCPGNQIQRRGEIFYECALFYRGNVDCAARNGIDPMKWYTACLRALCAAEGEAVPEDTCDILQQVVQYCGKNSGGHRGNGKILRITSCPPYPSESAMATPAAPIPRPWTPKCSLSDRSTSRWSDRVQSTPLLFRLFSSPYVYSELDFPCSYKLADLQCSGANIAVDVDLELDVSGFAVPSGVSVVISTVSGDGQVTSRNIDITHRDLQQLRDQSSLDNVSPWVSDLLSNAGSLQLGNDVELSYNETGQSVKLQRSRELSITYNYADYTNASRPNFGTVLSIVCSAPDFTGTNIGWEDMYLTWHLLDPLIIDPDHAHEFGYDVLFLARQSVKQKKAVCQEAKDVMSLGEDRCKHFGESAFDCRFLVSVKHYYGSCMLNNNLDRLQVLTSCMHVLCGTAEARTPKTCSVLQEVAAKCGATPAATRTDLYMEKGVHMQMATLLSKAGCV